MIDQVTAFSGRIINAKNANYSKIGRFMVEKSQKKTDLYTSSLDAMDDQVSVIVDSVTGFLLQSRHGEFVLYEPTSVSMPLAKRQINIGGFQR